jgi:hypothetical protein
VIGDGTALSARRLDLLDGYLTGHVADLLAHDDRVRHMAVRVEFRGGVAHLSGDVDEAGELAEVRRLVGGVAGVLAVWSRVGVAGRAPVQLDLGSGETRQYPDAYGVDLRLAAGVSAVVPAARGLRRRERVRRPDPVGAGCAAGRAGPPCPVLRPTG